MPVSASIYNQIQTPEAPNQLDSLLRAYKLQGAELESRQGRQAWQDDMALREATRAAGGDTNRLLQLLQQGGQYGAVQKLQASELARRKAEADITHTGAQTNQANAAAGNSQVDAQIKAIERVSSVLSTARDPQSYESAKQVIAQSFPQALSKLPPEYDPQAIAALIASGQTRTQQLASENAAGTLRQTALRDSNTNANAIALQEQQAREGALNRGVTMRGQDLTSRTAAEGHALTRARLNFDKGLDGNGKPLPASVVKAITEVRDNAATIDRLNSTFKDDYAGKGVLGFGADMQMDGAGRLGVDNAAVQWWKDYRKNAELVERHALFGAALTPTEQASWRSADVAPGMAADVVKANLATRAALTKKVFENAMADQVDAGHNATRIRAIGSRGPGGGGASGSWAPADARTRPSAPAADDPLGIRR